MRRTARDARHQRSGGFTLMELLIVILIILLIAAVALPVVIPAFNHRQVSAAASQLQAALVSARDAAIRAAAPRGIRLLPDPSNTGGVIAFNRWVAIETAPDYSIGSVSIKTAFQTPPIPAATPAPPMSPGSTAFNANPLLTGFNIPWFYPAELIPNLPAPSPPMMLFKWQNQNPNVPPTVYPPSALVVEEEGWQNGGATWNSKTQQFNGTPIPNEPVNWWWNVRVGDKIQIGGEGGYYSVIGPCEVRPTNPLTPGQNPELFVNVGSQGTQFPVSDPNGLASSTTGDSPLARAYGIPNSSNMFLQTVQFLILVNGVDDDGDGYIDSGWNGTDENVSLLPDDLLEWYQLQQPTAANPNPTSLFKYQEEEQWLGSLLPRRQPGSRTRKKSKGVSVSPTWDLPYTITRRPVPSPGARVTTLPANVVIDATTFNNPIAERSRFPIDTHSGYADILLNPNGSIVPTTVYSNPNSIGFGEFFYHFWLTERVDVVPPQPVANPVYGNSLPFPKGVPSDQATYLQGERALVSLFTKNGQIVSNSIENFNPTGKKPADLNAPFEPAQAGAEEAK